MRRGGKGALTGRQRMCVLKCSCPESCEREGRVREEEREGQGGN